MTEEKPRGLDIEEWYDVTGFLNHEAIYCWYGNHDKELTVIEDINGNHASIGFPQTIEEAHKAAENHYFNQKKTEANGIGQQQ